MHTREHTQTHTRTHLYCAKWWTTSKSMSTNIYRELVCHPVMFSQHLSNVTFFDSPVCRHEDTEAGSDAGVACSLCLVSA